MRNLHNRFDAAAGFIGPKKAWHVAIELRTKVSLIGIVLEVCHV